MLLGYLLSPLKGKIEIPISCHTHIYRMSMDRSSKKEKKTLLEKYIVYLWYGEKDNLVVSKYHTLKGHIDTLNNMKI